METKTIQESKINWLALVLIILGALQAADFAEVLSPQVAGTLSMVLGTTLGVIRTWFTNTTIGSNQ